MSNCSHYFVVWMDILTVTKLLGHFNGMISENQLKRVDGLSNEAHLSTFKYTIAWKDILFMGEELCYLILCHEPWKLAQ